MFDDIVTEALQKKRLQRQIPFSDVDERRSSFLESLEGPTLCMNTTELRFRMFQLLFLVFCFVFGVIKRVRDVAGTDPQRLRP